MKKIIAIILVLISVNSYSQITYSNYAAKKDSSKWQINGANISNKNTGNVGLGIAPLNKLHIGTASVANTGGIRLPITSASAAQTGQPIGVDANGDIVRLAATTFDATVDFSVNANPNIAGTTFNPNTPVNTGVLYVSTIDGSQWTYNGIIYIAEPVSSDWKITGNVGSVQATNFIGTTDNVGLNFRTNNVIRQTITNTGNVGIGTTTPLSKLDVVGGGLFGIQKTTPDVGYSVGANILNASTPTKISTIAITTPETALRLFSAGTNNVKFNPSADFQIGTYAAGVNAQTKLNIRLGNNSTHTPDVDVMTLQGNGNVGIGTTAPTTAKLVIAGAAGAQGLDLSTADQYSNMRVIQNTNSTIDKNIYLGFGSGAGSKLHLFSNNIETLVTSNGNVGIRTDAPTAKLEINNITAGSGLKFTQLNSATAPIAGAAPLGVDASGNVVTTPGSIFISVNGGNQNIGAAFTTVAMPTIVSVTGVPASNYNTATSEFTVPITGVYEITGTIRYADGQPAGNQFGVGVHTANSDGTWFLWHAIQTTTTPSRRTSFPYIRVERFTAGQTLRMISYVDGIPMNISAAGMQIRFLF